MILIKNDVDLITECGFLKFYINCHCSDFTKILLEEREEYLDYIKNQEESILEKIFK